MHVYYRKKQKTLLQFSPPHKRHYSYSYLSKIFTVNTIQIFSVYGYTFKNGIVLYLLLCNQIFFAWHVGSILPLSSNAFIYIFLKSCLFFAELIQILPYCCIFKLCPVFCSCKQSLTEMNDYPCT